MSLAFKLSQVTTPSGTDKDKSWLLIIYEHSAVIEYMPQIYLFPPSFTLKVLAFEELPCLFLCPVKAALSLPQTGARTL